MPGGAPQGYTGQMSLGGASFTLAVDAGGFKQQLDSAEAAARAAGRRIGDSFGQGSDAARGLLYLGQAVDDLQYGFRAVVNNIPQLVTAMGGGAGLAGAVGIAAVAVNQLINHWDELNAAMGQSQAAKDMATTIERIAAAIDDVSRAVSGRSFWELLVGPKFMNEDSPAARFMKYIGLTSGQLAAGRAAAGEKAEGDAALQALGKVRGKDEQGRAAMFKAALEQYGGGDKLVGEYAQRLMNGNPRLAEMDAQRLAARVIQNAAGGGAWRPGQFGLGFEKIFSDMLWKADTERLNRAGAENEALTKDLHRNVAGELNAQGAENERRLVANLQGERDALQKRLADERDRLGEMRPSQLFGSMREFLGSISVSGADQVRKQQLGKLTEIKAAIDKQTEQIKRIGGAKFQ